MPEQMRVPKNVVILAHPSPKLEFALTSELKGQQRPGGQQTHVCLSFPGGSRNE